MDRRLRSLVALLALFALSAYLAETARALLCPPGMETVAMSASADAAASHEVAGRHPTSSDGSRSAPSDASHCPLGMTSAGGACIAVALPAEVAIARLPVARHEAVFLSSDRTPDLLVLAGHFRPPRA